MAEKKTTPREVCPRCGTEKFRSEERTRVEARRTVRTTVYICERGHTFAKPIVKEGAGGRPEPPAERKGGASA